MANSLLRGFVFLIWPVIGTDPNDRCLFVSAGFQAPADGVFASSLGFATPTTAGETIKGDGAFCSACLSSPVTCLSEFACRDIPQGYVAPADGNFTVGGQTHEVIRGQEAPALGSFCMYCQRVHTGTKAPAAGRYVADGGATVADIVAGLAAPANGTFCVDSSGSSTANKEAAPLSDSDVRDHLSDLVISPKWTSFAGFNEASGMVSGTLALEYEWYFPVSEQYAQGMIDGQPFDAVEMTNFASGADGRVTSAMFSTADARANNYNYRKTAVMYKGQFHQKVNGQCYPWDTQVIQFEMVIPSPFDKVIQFILRCGHLDPDCVDHQTGFHQRNLTHLKHNKFKDKITKNFKWSALSCTKIRWNKVVCEMTGERDLNKRLTLQVVPGVIMSIIGFASFLIPPGMAMPRVATTMIALLTFVGKGTAVIAVMPKTGLSIVEEFYIIGMIFMMANMVGHILSWRKATLADFISNLQLGFTLILFILVMTIRVQVRECPGVSPTTSVSLVVVSTLALIVSVLWAVWGYRRQMKTHWDKVHQSVQETIGRSTSHLDPENEENDTTVNI